CRLGHAKRLEIRLSRLQGPMVGKRWAITPRCLVGIDRCVNCHRFVAFGNGDGAQNIVGIGLTQRIGTTLRSLPNVLKTSFCFAEAFPMKLQLGNCNQRAKFKLDHVAGARSTERMMKALVGAPEITLAKSYLALQYCGPNEITLKSSICRQVPSIVSPD